MFTHRVKSAMGLRLPQGAQEGVAAIYTHTKKSSHSNSPRASLDDEINPSFRLRHLLPPPPPAAPQLPASLLQLLSDLTQTFLVLPMGFRVPCTPPPGHLLPIPTVFLPPSRVFTQPSAGLPHRDAEAAGQSQLNPSNEQDMAATGTQPGGQRGRPGTPQALMPVSCHSCPERSQRAQERAGVGPHCSALTHLCQGHTQPSCQWRGEHSPTLQHAWGPAFLNGGRCDPSRLPSLSPQSHTLGHNLKAKTEPPQPGLWA